MAKRFIDTGLFDDPWFMDIGKDAKILWMYLITKCDHAGIIEINGKLLGFQTGIKSYQTVMEQLGNRLIHLRDNYYFMPKFIEFQYPGFPRSNVKQQQGAIKILESFGLIKEGKLTLTKDLTESYDNGIDNDNGNEDVNIAFDDFWDLYGKKVDRPKCETKWKNLKDKERQAIMNHLPIYKETTPDVKFRKDPATFFNNRSWENEVSKSADEGKTITYNELCDLSSLQGSHIWDDYECIKPGDKRSPALFKKKN